jgi:hypothetical protein
MPKQIVTAVTGISIILAFFDVIAWGTVGWIVLGCFGYLILMAFSNKYDKPLTEKIKAMEPKNYGEK